MDLERNSDHSSRYHQPVQSPYKLGDILANAITHGIGAVLAIAGAAYLITASTRGTAWHVVSCSIFSGTLVMVYVCSTLYHSLVRTRARHVFHVLDHSSIYLLIAGTYTPFCLISLHGRLGWTIFGIEWALAVAGVVFKSFAVGRFAVASALVYLFQGWFVVFALGPLVHAHRLARGDVAGRGRPGLHAGHRLLCPRPAALLPCHLAPVCAGRQHCALLCHPASMSFRQAVAVRFRSWLPRD